jgi:hypothetical protein
MSKSDAAETASTTPPARIGRTVALIGIDGAGKSTVAHEVVSRLPFDASYLYMGVNLEASPVMLRDGSSDGRPSSSSIATFSATTTPRPSRRGSARERSTRGFMATSSGAGTRGRT